VFPFSSSSLRSSRAEPPPSPAPRPTPAAVLRFRAPRTSSSSLAPTPSFPELSPAFPRPESIPHRPATIGAHRSSTPAVDSPSPGSWRRRCRRVARVVSCARAVGVHACSGRSLPSLVRVPVILVLLSLGGNAEARQLCACVVGLFVHMKKMSSVTKPSENEPVEPAESVEPEPGVPFAIEPEDNQDVPRWRSWWRSW